MMLGLVGSMASVQMNGRSWLSVSGSQELPPSVVFQTPPDTAPAYMMLVLAGLMTRLRVRPPMVLGPSETQVPRLAARGIASACRLAVRYRSVFSSPPGGVR